MGTKSGGVSNKQKMCIKVGKILATSLLFVKKDVCQKGTLTCIENP